MCEILYAARKDGLKREQLNGLLRAVRGMCERNPHGLGFLVNRTVIIKNIDPDKAWDALEQFAASKKITEVIAHARLASHGEKTTENAHPHISADGRFVVVHNGIFSNLGSAQVCDSAVFADALSATNGDIGAALKEAGGYWSVFILDTKSKKLYYTKHGAQFGLGYHPDTDTFYHATKLSIVSRAWSQRVFFDVFKLNKPIKLATASVDDDVIYEVKAGRLVRVGAYTIATVAAQVPLSAYTGTTDWNYGRGDTEIDEENEVWRGRGYL
jgi:hypothetical protein